MSLKTLLSHFSCISEMPIEISEIRDEIVKLGVQDEIFLSPEEIDPAKLRGVFYKYTRHNGVYGEPVFCCIIVYSSRMDPAWQRIVCCKEMVHLFDSEIEKTNTEEEVVDLVEKLLGPMTSENFGLTDLMAIKDKIALYQALALLFPDSAREEAINLREKNGATIEQIANWVCIPIPLAELVMTDDWPAIKHAFFSD